MSLEPDIALPLARICRDVGASQRTIERLFIEQTGLSLGKWRQQSRMLKAVQLLANRTPIAHVALEVGYSTPSAFAAAFRKHLGVPPSGYFGGSARDDRWEPSARYIVQDSEPWEAEKDSASVRVIHSILGNRKKGLRVLGPDEGNAAPLSERWIGHVVGPTIFLKIVSGADPSTAQITYAYGYPASGAQGVLKWYWPDNQPGLIFAQNAPLRVLVQPSAVSPAVNLSVGLIVK